MKNNWGKVKLSEICFYAKDKIDVASLNKKNYISTENILPNKNGITFATTIPNLKTTQYFKTGDILVSNIRPYFKKIWHAQFNGGASNDVLIFKNKDNIDSKFLYYVLSDDKFFEYCMTTSKGTKMPRGDKNSIMNYLIPNFDFETQKKITKVLSAFDDKIELNNKINENLEQQAKAIFKSWFIDFEPFGGKMPNDWKKGTFSELIDYAIGGDWGKEKIHENYTEKVYCIRGADIPDVRNGNKGKMPFRYILPKNYENKKLSNGDLVVEMSGGSPTQSTGRIAVITDYLLNRYDNKIVCTNFCRALKPKKDYSMFIYYYWLYMYSKDVFFSYENGTTGIKNFDITGFLETEKIVIPNEEVLKRFSNLCISFEKQIFSNGYENEQLANLRDTLLPKLMNGEIDVDKIKI